MEGSSADDKGCASIVDPSHSDSLSSSSSSHVSEQNSDASSQSDALGTSDATGSQGASDSHTSANNIAWCLAPMVRVGNLSFRALCLRYGADLVWSEELIAQRLARCTRRVNERLGTIDFITPRHGKHKNNSSQLVDGIAGGNDGPGEGGEDTVVLRIDPVLEAGKLIVQLGASTASDALAATRVIEDDIHGIDINMGCPKRFSVQGGMGAALLQDPIRAQDIIRTLATNLPGKRVSAKIRLLDSMDETVEFMRGLEAAGAHGITVHLRHRETREWQDADWSSIDSLTTAVSVPVFLNGDFYLPTDIHNIAARHSNVGGVMLARPALMNPSVFRCKGTIIEPLPVSSTYTTSNTTTDARMSTADATTSIPNSTTTTERSDGFLPLLDTVLEYVRLSVRYETPYQLVKYTIMEMMNTGRHTRSILPKLHEAGIDFGRLSAFEAVQSSRSLQEISRIFGLYEATACGGDDASKGKGSVADLKAAVDRDNGVVNTSGGVDSSCPSEEEPNESKRRKLE